MQNKELINEATPLCGVWLLLSCLPALEKTLLGISLGSASETEPSSFSSVMLRLTASKSLGEFV